MLTTLPCTNLQALCALMMSFGPSCRSFLPNVGWTANLDGKRRHRWVIARFCHLLVESVHWQAIGEAICVTNLGLIKRPLHARHFASASESDWQRRLGLEWHQNSASVSKATVHHSSSGSVNYSRPQKCCTVYFYTQLKTIP